jgi:UPF0755 protein
VLPHEAHSEQPLTRAQLRQQQGRSRKRRRRSGKRSLVLLLTLSLVLGGSFAAYRVLGPMVQELTASNDYAGIGTGQATVVIPPGASGRTIGSALVKAGVVKSTKAFVQASDANPKSAGIQPGAYILRQKMSAAEAITMLLDPKVRAAGQVLIREGLRATEVIALLTKATKKPSADYAAALKDPAKLGLPAAAKGKVEGWLFPGTYAFTAETSAAEQLKTMIEQTQKLLDSLSISAANAQEILIEASIAQVEGGNSADFAKVTRVIENRLADKLGNGAKLQMDSTVSYAVNKSSLLTTSADRNSSSPYNTYRYGGLPAGPISNPGKAAIQAAQNPTPGDWLFFVTVDPSTGETKFAETVTEHNKNVAEFQTWCRANKDQCD